RPGNGALDALRATGEFTPPSLLALEAALEYGLSLRLGRVFADLWDIQTFSRCLSCDNARINRLSEMNRTQTIPEPILCDQCRRIR
ncbi:radical SAM protein, partial [Singulisphaera rosea]